MSNAARLLLAAPLLTLVLASCGGSGGDDNELSVPNGIVRFRSVANDFNGSPDDLNTNSGSRIPDGSTTVVLVSNAPRNLEIVLPAQNPAAGDTFTLGTSQSGATGRYSQIITISDQRVWTATSGTARVVSVDGSVTTVRLESARFEAQGGSNLATGAFTLDGEITANTVQN